MLFRQQPRQRHVKLLKAQSTSCICSNNAQHISGGAMFAPRLPKDIDPASLLTQISDQKNRDGARYFHFLGLPGDNAFRRLMNLPSNSWTNASSLQGRPVRGNLRIFWVRKSFRYSSCDPGHGRNLLFEVPFVNKNGRQRICLYENELEKRK